MHADENYRSFREYLAAVQKQFELEFCGLWCQETLSIKWSLYVDFGDHCVSVCLFDVKRELQIEWRDELNLILYPELLFLIVFLFIHLFIQSVNKYFCVPCTMLCRFELSLEQDWFRSSFLQSLLTIVNVSDEFSFIISRRSHWLVMVKAALIMKASLWKYSAMAFYSQD